ncbi:hypothetical protein [Adhaeretor mobilis]|uniref:Uncharacterized protein n=1 Tax=Adhaeretor mobilis TaxID=1930276 RepID=A0A517MWN7_9BACT|nr:hypothetical protein [Adhaeretor mobilis]QDS99296.1 hypothetical protein HG15A2_26180 [Adhaeretor mobilis]
MLGCQDFCGYYDWTFRYLRRKFGEQALKKYWAEAIASDSQAHYLASGEQAGLRGLYSSWSKSGEDEHCDWSVTLDEEKNVLRLDMHECPSKGFLLQNDLNSDEDYCDHCIGWIGPALTQIGVEVSGHEHNHCGQCWWEMRMVDTDSQPIAIEKDIRSDSRWKHGYLHSYVNHTKQPLVEGLSTTDSCELLQNWFHKAERIVVLGSDSAVGKNELVLRPDDAVIATGKHYALGATSGFDCRAVILEHEPDSLYEVANRYNNESGERPLLLYSYLPQKLRQAFLDNDLPRPLPILPMLIREGQYVHQPEKTAPTTVDFAKLLAHALGKPVVASARNLKEPQS